MRIFCAAAAASAKTKLNVVQKEIENMLEKEPYMHVVIFTQYKECAHKLLELFIRKTDAGDGTSK